MCATRHSHELRKSHARTFFTLVHQSALLAVPASVRIASLTCCGRLGQASTTTRRRWSAAPAKSVSLPGLLLVSWGCSSQSVGVALVTETSCGFVNRRSTVRVRSVALILLARKCRLSCNSRRFPARLRDCQAEVTSEVGAGYKTKDESGRLRRR